MKLVEKRTLVFVLLAIIVWAALASAFVGYYYLENSRNSAQLVNANNSLDTVASTYFDATSKYDSLQSEYGTLYGNYYYFSNSDYTALMPSFGALISDFSKNYSDLFVQADINGTYNQLLTDYQELSQEGNISRTDFGNLLSEYYNLFSLCAIKELGQSISNAATLSVSILINYGNGTLEWNNETQVPAGTNLFEITQQISVVKYSYYATAEPGHVFVDSINNLAEYATAAGTSGYSWFWYYSNDNGKTWTEGQVGCDAWLLANGGVYEWNYTSW